MRITTFETRLKIFLGAIALVAGLILVRSAQLQIVDGGFWTQRAVETLKRPMFIETTRGNVVDFQGRRLAFDDACTDVVMEYRAIVADPEWIRQEAENRLNKRLGSDFGALKKKQKAAAIDEEAKAVSADLDASWKVIADEVAASTGEDAGVVAERIEDAKAAIVQRVQMRQRSAWYRKYQAALTAKDKRAPEPWYKRWLITGDNAPADIAPDSVTVEEQNEQQVILRDVNSVAVDSLREKLDVLPGLALAPSLHRVYPYGPAAAQIIGPLSAVKAEDLQNDPDSGNDLRQYLPNDLIGRGGVEQLCEQALRGTRGQVVKNAANDQVLSSLDPMPGKNVRLTIDVELQRDLMESFEREHTERQADGSVITRSQLHGSAVVIDVATGQVRALVSCPSYDMNQYDRLYPALSKDDLNQPLLNRPLQSKYEPGSTMKPIIALGALTDKTLTLDTTIECTGYLIINGYKWKSLGRCWTARMFGDSHPELVAHHQIPTEDPHPSGFLTVVDAIQRSCNVFFETTADRMGLARVVYWQRQFGLGRITGIGLDEKAGRVPSLVRRPGDVGQTTWFAGIGQGDVAATPMQMANVAATIARNGIWVRPRIVVDDGDAVLPAGAAAVPDQVDLGLDPAYLAAVKEGMVKVVNTIAGTGGPARRDDMVVAGKSGSAQLTQFAIPSRDSSGQIIKTPDGRVAWMMVEPNSQPWFQGTGDKRDLLVHGWFIGFAPADKPQIAFAVMVEFGGSGHVAGEIAADLLNAAVAHGYLTPNKIPTASAAKVEGGGDGAE